MSKRVVCILIILLVSQMTWAAQINLRVETDRADYKIGQTVSWTIYAWASQGDNRGVAYLTVSLDDDQGEVLSPPAIDGLQFDGTEYGLAQNFMKLIDGIPAPMTPRLRDMTVMQAPKLLDIGNDGLERVFAHGQYEVATNGTHQLNVSLNDANYWLDATATNPVQFETNNTISATFGVYYRGDINRDGRVDILDLEELSRQWLSVPGSPSADIEPLNGDGFVDLADFAILAGDWLLGT